MTRTRNSKYKKILNTEHKFVTLYVFNSAQNIFIYYSVQFFTYCNKKENHHAINDIIWRSLQSADVPSMKEPSGLLMASRPMVPHSFPGLPEDTWPGMPQWSTLVLHHTCRRQQSRQVLQLSRLLFARLPNMYCCLQPMCLSPLPSKLLGL